jgi:DNA-binding NtrC family response regulator
MKKPELLLIDDEPMVGQRLRGGLEKLGCTVTVSENPVSALDLIQKKMFDIIITDVMMPEISGLQVLEAARAANPETRVIIITGFATASLAREAMEKGAFDMIAKPFKPADLRKLVVKSAGTLGYTDIKEY